MCFVDEKQKLEEVILYFFISVFLPTLHQIFLCTSSILKFNFHNIKVNYGNSEEKKNLE